MSFRPKAFCLLRSGKPAPPWKTPIPAAVAARGIEFHDGSVHRKVRTHSVRILVDEEFRGE
jgi:hypothetical protein